MEKNKVIGFNFTATKTTEREKYSIFNCPQNDIYVEKVKKQNKMRWCLMMMKISTTDIIVVVVDYVDGDSDSDDDEDDNQKSSSSSSSWMMTMDI